MADHLLRTLRRRARLLKTENAAGDCAAEELCLLAEDGRVADLPSVLPRVGHVNVLDCTGQTALHVAVASGQVAMVSALLKTGAIARVTDSSGRTAVDLVQNISDKHRRAEIKKLLSEQQVPAQRPQYLMGDCGDAESGFLHDFETSYHSTIFEAKHAIELHEVDDSTDSGDEGSDMVAQDATLNSENQSLVLVMVGLPGRGKTYIARRLCRWLNWKGTGCRIFNVGKYRRDLTQQASEQVASYFDPQNPDAVEERERLAGLAMRDLILFIEENPGCVAIFDATNSTIDRRARLVETFTGSKRLPTNRVIFIESVCTDDTVIHSNILRAKMGNEDYQGKEASYVLSDFKDRISQYEKVYQPLTLERDSERSWVQLRNTIGRGGGHIKINNISGHLPTKLLYFLFNLKTAVCPVYIARVGSGEGYAAALRRFINTRHDTQPFRVWTSTGKTATQSIQYFTGSRFLVRHYLSLRDLDRGEFRSLSDEQVKRAHPQFFRELKSCEYAYAWPRGESYHDLNVRLEQIILDIHGSDIPILIVAAKEVCQGLYAYLAELRPEICLYLDFPERMVAEFAYKNHSVNVSMHDLRESSLQAPQDEDARAEWAEAEDSDPVPLAERNPHESLPDYLKAQPISTVAVGQTQVRKTPFVLRSAMRPESPTKPINMGPVKEKSLFGSKGGWQDDTVSC
eukprot:TRINITY_DN269_c2_g1_i1.p1 TRINITY_DN269_c2_g1~~TRINITY_DN269_c2_g1_i1.p1  ORF type:complete len:685 (+),score=211.47 TRINITY_DN269_c2_g1_i1:298-2352(+)